MNYTSREVYEFISHKTNDPIIERKTCTISGTQFPIYQSDVNFYNKISPTFAGQKFQIPTPTLCPEERQRRRVSFRNERKLYRRKCDASGVDMISIYSPDKPHKVYNQKYRWSDNRDPMIYGFELDFSKNFTENFDLLLHQVPHCALFTNECEDCNYANYANGSKSCYMCFGSTLSENSEYSHFVYKCINTLDGETLFDCENCYECSDCGNCNNCQFTYRSENCYSCTHVRDCKNCSFCIGCKGLENKQYHIFNKQYSKEEYEIQKNSLSVEQINKGLQKIQGIKNTSTNIIGSEGCTGNNIYQSGNCHFSFDTKNAQDSRRISNNPNAQNSYDIDYAAPKGTNGVVEGLSSLGSSYSIGIAQCWDCSSLYYSFENQGCSDCFGCIGLRNKQYCIFNKQYTKEEYEIQVAKIITHMMTTGERGEFFHPSLSPFGYNETVAQEYYPVKQGELTEFGYKWSDYSSDPKIPAGASTLTGNQVPSNITETSDDILKQVLICEISGRPYMIQKAELDFYRKHHLPVPRKHPDVRHEERMKLRPGRTLHFKTCDNCNKEMLSVYSEDHQGKIYCEECYQKEVFG